ncbi:hypothetical protein [Micrococcus terreus]|uniref:hypothetical protein n=1 Tax=Micrococcus terreus TaxID=574650 RepID=UPI003D71BEFF
MITDASTATADFIRSLTRYAGQIGVEVPARPNLTVTDLNITPLAELREQAAQIIIDGGDPFSDKKLMGEINRQQAATVLNIGPVLDQAAVNKWWAAAQQTAPAIIEAARAVWEQHAPTVQRIAAAQGDFNFREVRVSESTSRAKAALDLMPALQALESALWAWTYAQAAARGQRQIPTGSPALIHCRGIEAKLEHIDHAAPVPFFRDFRPINGSMLYTLASRGAKLSLVKDEAEAQARVDALMAEWKRSDDEARGKSWAGLVR